MAAHYSVFSLPGVKDGDGVPRKKWVHGLGTMLLCRAMVFETANEEEERAVEMLICGELKKNKVALLNPKDMDGGRTEFPKSNFAVGVTVLMMGGLE